MKKNYQGWLYETELIGDKMKFSVLDSDGKYQNIPKNMYKYYALSNNSVDALTHLYIYATSPYQLNDPLDCNTSLIQIDEENSMKELWQDLYEKVNKQYLDIETRQKVSNQAFSEIIFRKWGVFSMTPNKDSEIMWALYSQNSGFRLEFDISKFPFNYSGPFPIHYCNEMQTITSSKYSVPTMALIQTNIKYDQWSYEDEWRLMIHSPDGFDMQTFGPNAKDFNRPDDHDRKFKYPLSALKSITLGYHFFKDAQEEHRLFVLNGMEMQVIYPKKCLQTDVLDFLNEVQQKYPLKVCLASIKNYKLKDISVKVIKLSDYTYQFIEL